MDIKKMFDFKDKVIVITGGAGVLCSQMARSLGELGSKVVLLDIAEKELKQLKKEFKSKDISCLTINTDVLKKDQLEKAASKVLQEYGRVDVLINGAGGNKAEATTGPDKSFFDLPEEAVTGVFDLNFKGTFLACQVFGKIFADQKEGNILNISSMNAFTPLTKIPAYSAAKAAVSNFTRWLAVHMSQNYSTEIRVNALAPGFLLTEQNRFLLINQDDGTLTERGQTIIDHTPMEQFGEPEDLITTVIWLLASGTRFVHGTVIPVDGGFSAFSGV